MRHILILGWLVLLVVPVFVVAEASRFVPPSYRVNLTPIIITHGLPGGTSPFLTKSRLHTLRMSEAAWAFPYDLDDTVRWVRQHKVSVMDPVSKKSLLVSLLSDGELKSLLLHTLARAWWGVNEAGLPQVHGRQVFLGQTPGGRWEYRFTAPTVEDREFRSAVSSYEKSVFNAEPPQQKDLARDVAWVRANVQTIYDPRWKQERKVNRLTPEELRDLLKIKSVRLAIGLPPLGTAQ